jgi:Tfp pilus assembly protein PilO
MKLTRKFKKRELILIWVCLIIIGISLISRAINRVNFNLSKLETEIALNQQKLLRLNALFRQSKELNSQYEKLFTGYKEFKDSDSLLQAIANIAKRLNLNILNIKPGITKDDGLYQTYSVKVDVQDDIYTLVRFIQVLTEELKSIDIEQLQIYAQASKEELPKAGILINAAVFKK